MDVYLVTGASGCLGAWVQRVLLDDNAHVVAFDISKSNHRLAQIASPTEMERITTVVGDIRDPLAIGSVIDGYDVTHVVHLAALQIPQCAADPVVGAQVNVVGTCNVFEAVKERQDRVKGLVYASSAAVYGSRGDQGIPIEDDEPQSPDSLYGVYKVADEGIARVYAKKHGLGSIGLRPFVVYGPGRDSGMTAAMTNAIDAAIDGRDFEIDLKGTILFQYAGDVAKVVVDMVRTVVAGQAPCLNIGGKTATVQEFADIVRRVVPTNAQISVSGAIPHLAPSAVTESGLIARRGPSSYVEIEDGIRRTVEILTDARSEKVEI